MHLRVNERTVDVDEKVTLCGLKSAYKQDADIMILNGAPVAGDIQLVEGDRVVFIRRGETPDKDELEALMVARHTPGVHEKVSNAVVAVAGTGGLGSNVAIALARLGTGKLVLADFDVVEPSNLNRQQFFVDQIGMPKVLALAETLRRINPYLAIETHAVRLDEKNCESVFRGADVIVEAFDRAESKAMLASTVARIFPETPLVMASGLAGHDSGNSIVTRQFGSGIYLVGDLVNEAAAGRGLMSPRVGIAAHHQANTVLRLLLGETGV